MGALERGNRTNPRPATVVVLVGRQPVAVVDLRVPPDEVDFNVHPSKRTHVGVSPTERDRLLAAAHAARCG